METEEQRQRSLEKILRFGQIYGMGEAKLDKLTVTVMKNREALEGAFVDKKPKPNPVQIWLETV